MFRDETHEQRRERIYATKSNAKRRIFKSKYAKPKETADLQAQRATAAKEAVRKLVNAWLELPEVSNFAKIKSPKSHEAKLSTYIRSALRSVLEDIEEYNKILEKK